MGTISLPTTTPGAEAEDVRETKTDSDATRENLMTVSQHRDTMLKTLLQNESKSQEVTTSMAEVKSIRDDNQMMTTPIPRDLQLSESITSVYLHNSSSIPAVTNNIKTPLTKPKKDQVPNSISLLPFSKLTNQILDSSPSTVAPPRQEPVFTVTPVSTARASSSTMMTYSDLETSTVTETTEMTTMADLYSGQYYEGHEGRYQNLESAYPGDYEVNEVKVDFDNRDEHKIYNVQAKAGDFIIGEVGKIDVNNGQTVEGVRYTALEGEVDPLKIAEILNRYFGTRTS